MALPSLNQKAKAPIIKKPTIFSRIFFTQFKYQISFALFNKYLILDMKDSHRRDSPEPRPLSPSKNAPNTYRRSHSRERLSASVNKRNTQPNGYQSKDRRQYASRENSRQRKEKKDVVKTRKLFISNIDGRIPEDEVREGLIREFDYFGPIAEITVKTKFNSTNTYAFIEYESQHDATKALKQMSGMSFKGQYLKVQYSKGETKRTQDRLKTYTQRRQRSPEPRDKSPRDRRSPRERRSPRDRRSPRQRRSPRDRRSPRQRKQSYRAREYYRGSPRSPRRSWSRGRSRSRSRQKHGSRYHGDKYYNDRNRKDYPPSSRYQKSRQRRRSFSPEYYQRRRKDSSERRRSPGYYQRRRY